MSNRKQPLLRFKFDGSAVHDGRILYDDLSTFISNVSLAIERIINKMQTGESIKRGRPLEATRLLSALEIVSVRKGSFAMALDLRRNGQQFQGWDMGERAVFTFVSGIEALQNDEELPPEYDYGVLVSLREAGRIIDRGVETVRINTTSTFGRRQVTYVQPVRDRIRSRLQRYEHAFSVVEGRLLMLDVQEDKLRCRLQPSTGKPIPCRYDEELTEQIVKCLRQFIQARGDATFDPASGKMLSLDIKDIEPIGEASGLSSVLPVSSFWRGKTFDELATEQAVYPIVSDEELSGDWPQDADFDKFLDAVRSARA